MDCSDSDGYELVTYSYRPDDPHSIPASEAFGLFADRRGRLWLSTRNRGLAYYAAEIDRFRTFHPEALPVLDPTSSRFQQTGDGTIWLMTATGLLRFEESRQTFTQIAIELSTDDETIPVRPRTFIAVQDWLFWTDSRGRLFSWRPASSATPADGPVEIELPR